MRDLCDATGLNRQAIHFYIQQGLLPPGEKTGRNTATYTPAHLERLQLIRRLQHERFLPLEVIKDLLSAREDRYSDAQRAFLRRLRARLPGGTPLVMISGDRQPTVPLGERVRFVPKPLTREALLAAIAEVTAPSRPAE